MKHIFLIGLIAIAAIAFPTQDSNACTGITLKAKDGSYVVARTIEWSGSFLNSQYVIVPRGYKQQSFVPGGTDGMAFTARYGYVGLSVEQEQFVVEGINEVGLSAGLFYFPQYGQYEAYDAANKNSTITDLQLVSWILGSCKNIDEVKKAIPQVHVTAIDPRASTVHWRFADESGQQIVLEFIDGKPIFYENKLGVLTNAPDFKWQITNLNNYVNLSPGSTPTKEFGNITLSQFGAGSGLLGIPGDITPPSRFVRAAFYQISAPQGNSAKETVLQCFHILNNFDIPIGAEFSIGKITVDIPSATQWTTATDVSNRVIYYRTMYNSNIRRINLKDIDFSKVKYQCAPLDKVKEEPILDIKIK